MIIIIEPVSPRELEEQLREANWVAQGHARRVGKQRLPPLVSVFRATNRV